MENVPLVPVNFRISKAAQAMLSEMTEHLSEEMGCAMVLALLWGEDYDEIRKELITSGIAWGGFPRSEVPTRLLQEIDGISLVFGVEPKHATYFSGRVLDYTEDRRFFLTE